MSNPNTIAFTISTHSNCVAWGFQNGDFKSQHHSIEIIKIIKTSMQHRLQSRSRPIYNGETLAFINLGNLFWFFSHIQYHVKYSLKNFYSFTHTLPFWSGVTQTNKIPWKCFVSWEHDVNLPIGLPLVFDQGGTAPHKEKKKKHIVFVAREPYQPNTSQTILTSLKRLVRG